MIQHGPKWSNMVPDCPKKITQPLGTKKNHPTSCDGKKITQSLGTKKITQPRRKKSKCPKWLQMVPNGSKWLQMAPNGSKWLQIAPNGSKWLQCAPHGSTWLQMAPNYFKWLWLRQMDMAMAQHCPKWS